MDLTQKRLRYQEVLKRFDIAYRDAKSIISTNNPLADEIKESIDNIHNVYMMYHNFNKLRNSIVDSDHIQKNFEEYLEHLEEIIEKIRNTAESLAKASEEFESLDESKMEDVGTIIREQIKKVKTWISKSIKKLKIIHTMIKNDMAMLEKEIKKEFSKIK
jgi:hypothetical protein